MKPTRVDSWLVISTNAIAASFTTATTASLTTATVELQQD